uniref:Uncharacterized protein n=1 Tax=Anopheles dirus TaxID=7168 RepID=A0A182ND27_9DIPT
MPPTIGNIAAGAGGNSTQSSHITTRTTRRSSAASRYANSAPSIATRNSQGGIARKGDNRVNIPEDYELLKCSVVVDDVLRQNAVSNNANGGKSRRTTAAKEVLPAPEPHSYVTRRTKPREKAKPNGETQRHTISVVEEDHHSIINLDDSNETSSSIRATRSTQSISVIPHVPRTQRQTQNKTRADDVTLKPTDATIPEERLTRRNSSRADEGSKNMTSSRVASKRKPDIAEPALPIETGMSPPKKMVLESSTVTVADQTIMPAAHPVWCNLDNSTFRVLVVSIKRIAPALTEAALNRLKHPDIKQEARISQHAASETSTRASTDLSRPTRSLVEPRSTIPKPQIVVTSSIVEAPESPTAVPTRTVLEQNESKSSNHLTVPSASKSRLNTFKKPLPVNKPTLPPQLPILIEEENEENDKDVYEFLSSSQTSDTNSSVKPAHKPKPKKKAKAKPSKASNPFGKCKPKQLSRLIKKIGGGPVKQPATVDYVVNLKLPKTPPVATGPIVPEFTLDEPPIANPLVERLKTQPARSRLLSTSTPASKPLSAGNLDLFPLSPRTQPASPWRLQDDKIVPRTNGAHRTREMLPSYESFSNENHNISEIPRSPAYVTERDNTKQPPALPEETSSDIISEHDLREFEQMYSALKATSEMSEKLISAMRKCKSKAATPQQLQDRRRYKANMQQACLKLKKWYDRSMQSFTHSMRIIGNIQRAAACPSPLSHDQQRAVENFNLSTDRFRTMLDDMQSAMNDSDLENRPPPMAVASAVKAKNATTTAQDVVMLPERGPIAQRNPLMPLNFMPLPQRDSPLMSPLAKDLTSDGKEKTPLAAKSFRRGELQYDKENESFITTREVQTRADASDNITDGNSVVVILDETADNATEIGHKDNPGAEVSTGEIQHNSKNASKENYFGFVDDEDNDDDAVESSLPQVTLPMPLNISNETLQHRLKNMNKLLPRRPIFRQQPIQSRSSGPTRFPPVKAARVFSSPSQRPKTLREFVASTPRLAPPPVSSSSTTAQAVPAFTKTRSAAAIEAPDVSAIEPNIEPESAAENNAPDVVLFDTPEQPSWLNNSAHQRTYTRVPRLRRKKINVYLANLGLDDDDDDDSDVSDDPQDLISSDSEAEGATKGKKNKKKNQKRKKGRKPPPVPVEQVNVIGDDGPA